MTAEEFCAKEKECDQIATCAEAYYRLAVCKHGWLDGGTRGSTYEKPDSQGQPNGVPCEKKCGSDARAMVPKIWAETDRGEKPFTLPMTTSKTCDPT
jgi:hypothetical protein